MKSQQPKRFKWRRLDNSAKLFPIMSNKKFSTVYRMSAVLTEDIKPDILETAVQNTLNRFISYKVRLRKGFFWYFLEYNPKDPIIEIENNYPCKYIDKNTNNGYLFKITYYNQKINIDVFHSLTDGSSAIKFFKEIIYNYIELCNKEEFKISYRDKERIIDNNTEDSYLKNYNKKIKGKRSAKKAYIIKGNNLPLYATGVIHGFINMPALKQLCTEKQCTLTQYLTATLIYAIYEKNFKNNNSKKPIKVCIPVDLKKYFSSSTISNFFSYIIVQANMNNGKAETFERILQIVKEEFKKNLTEEEVIKTMTSNVRLGNNIFIRILPLFIKKFTVKISYTEIRKNTTTTLSNVGRISIMPEYSKYIKNFMVLLAPEKIEKIKCSACSYDDNLVVTFTSILDNIDIQNEFFNHIKNQGIDVKIESNGVYDAIS